MHLLLGIFVACITLALDQYSKYWLLEVYGMLERQQVAVFPGFNLVAVWNYGVSFGMFHSLGLDNANILIIFAALLTLVLMVWLVRAKQRFLSIALGLVIGGALGNIIDRARFGAVFDFLDVYIGAMHWPAFNIADSAICIGVCFILIDSFLCNTKKTDS